MSTPFPNNNAEQLDAEFQAGMGVGCNLDVSLTTLMHLVVAAQYAARCLDLANPSRAVWRDFAQDCVAKCEFPPEMSKLIANDWPDEPVQTSGRKEEP